MQVGGKNKHFYPVLFLLFVAPAIYASPDFFTPDKYLNIGDFEYRFQINDVWLDDYFYAWNAQTDDGLGGKNLPRFPVQLFFYSIFAGLKFIGLPDWILNRLFLLLPAWLLLFSTYSFLNFNLTGYLKYAMSASGAFFVLVAPPHTFIAPLYHLILSGTIMILCGVQRYLVSPKGSYLCLMAIGLFLSSIMPRYPYLGFVLSLIYVVAWYLLKRGDEDLLKLPDLFKGIFIFAGIALLLNLNMILPLIVFFGDHSSRELMVTEDALNYRLALFNMFRGYTGIFSSMRLIDSTPGRIYEYYFSHKIIRPFTFIIPLLIAFALLRVFVKGENKRVQAIGILLVFSWVINLIFGSDFYALLVGIIPGFWIFNNPTYYVSMMAFFSAVLLTYVLLEMVDFLIQKWGERWKRWVEAGGIVFFISIIFIHCGYFIVDKIPESRRLYATAEWFDHATGARVPYFEIPQEYFDLKKTMASDPEARVMILPELFGYTRYTWYPVLAMPEILHQMTTLRLGATSEFDSAFITNTINTLMTNVDKALFLMGKGNYNYIFLHKDLLPHFGPVRWKKWAAILGVSNCFPKVMDNDHFIFYKIDYSCRQVKKEAGIGTSIETPSKPL
ncbi:MAG: hypothetical protein COV67_11065 [Nitrospinae bacterium CG11_big_fil_rev_8_21_14_0_20_56_8]|nr:MAG: hypothetical protein COV67_11065 [Nitrospinae bacterium CG11_big_fil_rev_8_21_14_0_20_56_8]